MLRVGLVLVPLAAVAIRRPGLASGRAARVWLVALLAAGAYKPLHPVPHDYLRHPVMVAWSVGVAVLVERILEARVLPPMARLVSVVAIVGAAVPGPPAFCNLEATLAAPAFLAKGTPPQVAPPGYVRRATLGNAACYAWADYRDVLLYLRERTGPQTQVANVLKGFPAINGPVGRPSPFAAESGLVWAWAVDPTIEARFAEALEETPDSVVVWTPGEVGPVAMDLDRLAPAIRRLYRPEARFGPIEVWRRRREAVPRRPRDPGAR
jgi:hypothetical protein